MNNKNLNPINFSLEYKSLWSFPIRGNWATHEPSYRGNWSPYIPRNIILRYSNPGDIILDQFVGGGTTLIEAKLLNRNAIGIDINSNSLSKAKHKCNFNSKTDSKIYLRNADASNLYFIKDNSIDLICTHPPYSNIIKYSNNIKGDLSLLNPKDFLKQMKKVSYEAFRVLKSNHYCAILIGDIRIKGHVYPLGFHVMNTFLESGFSLKEIIIKEQHNCMLSDKWKKLSFKRNFFLLSHEYIFVFKK